MLKLIQKSKRLLTNWQVECNEILRTHQIFLLVINTVHFQSHFIKTPVGCTVGLHSVLVLPFTIALVQPLLLVVRLMKFCFLGKDFVGPFLLTCVNSFTFGYSLYQKLK